MPCEFHESRPYATLTIRSKIMDTNHMSRFKYENHISWKFLQEHTNLVHIDIETLREILFFLRCELTAERLLGVDRSQSEQ